MVSAKVILFNTALEAVIERTGFTKEEILTSGHEEPTDARFVLVCSLTPYLTDLEIASVASTSRPYINNVRNHFESRTRKFSVRYLLKEVKKIVVSKAEGLMNE